MSIFYLCQKYKIDFRIYWAFPFSLEDYLIPSHFDWRINFTDLDFQKSKSTPIVIDFGNGIANQAVVDSIIFYNRVIKSNYKQYHIYSNSIIGKKHFRNIFNTLFKVSSKLEAALKPHKEPLGQKYLSVSTRFMELLGDFKDQEGVSKTLPNSDQDDLIEKCYNKISEIIEKLPSDYKIFVASDSSKFLKRVTRNNRMYVVPGDIVHLRYKGSEDAYMKTFVDLLLISQAEKQILLRTGEMYNSGFPRFASWIGSNNFELIDF